ncbi:MAG: YggS family pyridoxal phosphate-dependent enzyme [Sediminibacterium sp.]|jgi:pyridoxal phosphate enzyme (YggS family)|nr:YggS family pyridoxal phosphate-dependent enzyme [Sediminibacterium sp.]
MPVNTNQYHSIISQLNPQKVQLIAVSKTKPNEDIIELYDLGQRAFGENYVQELVDKAASLPKDIQWHFIGHLQSNKVKYIAPFVHLIHGVDSEKLLQEINKQAIKQNRIIDCLLQVHIATEETKFGFDADSIDEFIQSGRLAQYPNIQIKGLMGMASFSEDTNLLTKEFTTLKQIFDQAAIQLGNQFTILSMGMSGDYTLAISLGSNMVRIGSLLFGARNYSK